MLEQDCILIDSDEEGDKDEDMDEIFDFVDSKYWYSITIETPLYYSSEELLAAILHTVAPLHFVPVFLSDASGGSWGGRKFYVTQCRKAIRKISGCGLQVQCRGDTIQLKVNHNDPPPGGSNPHTTIRDALLMRFTRSLYKLDLSNLQNDFLLRGKIYFPLWYSGNQKLLRILIQALSLAPSIHSLDLSQNQISSIVHLNLPVVFSSVRSLDLSRNNLRALESLKVLLGHTSHVTSVDLNGNPLCSLYSGEQSYIHAIKHVFPAVTTLDGVALYTECGLPRVRRNYCREWDAVSLVDNFMSVFFTLFDLERESSILLYTPKAILTISGKVGSGEILPLMKLRNLLDSHIPYTAKVYTGPRSIRAALLNFPKTQHDPLGFHVDIISHSGMSTVVVVSGVLRVPASSVSEEEPMLEFSRTFHLVHTPPNTYKIINDLLSLRPATSQASQEAFKNIQVSRNVLSLQNIEHHLTESTMKTFIDIFIHLTEFPHSEAKLYLENNKWDIRAALLDAAKTINKIH